MTNLSQHADRCSALLKKLSQEDKRTVKLLREWLWADCEVGSALSVNVGRLLACLDILRTMQRGADVLDEIEAIVRSVKCLNASLKGRR